MSDFGPAPEAGDSPSPAPEAGDSPSPANSSSGVAVAVGIIGGRSALGLFGILLIFLYKRLKKKYNNEIGNSNVHATPRSSGGPDHKGEISVSIADSEVKFSVYSNTARTNSPGELTLPYEELVKATNGFSRTNLIGQGGFGCVYRGVLANGREVAIKQLKVGSFQGDREFAAEVETIIRIHHRNLVSLVGYCNEGSQRLLVYEYMANNSLDYLLHAPGAPTTIRWDTRMQIAIGSAKGLAYLHEDCEPKIIHRDIKASNILLDSNFNAKVSDFGLAKFVCEANTHVTTRILGTIGYLDPEYASNGRLTEKSDVYAFGVVLLELISGRTPTELVSWARPLLAEAKECGIYDALVDPELENSYDLKEMARMVACANACVMPVGNERPQMIQIARVLEGIIPANNL